MKRFDAFTKQPCCYSSCNYLTITKTDSDGISVITQHLPQAFLNARKRLLTILNFEAFYINSDDPQVMFRSDCTELLSDDIGFRANEYNNIICLSGRGFCGYLYYDMSQSTRTELTIRFNDPNPNEALKLHPNYVCIQLMLEYDG